MGKQTSFYMEREVFQELAQEAIDCGCLILRQSGNKIVSSRDTSIITASCDQYYFYPLRRESLTRIFPWAASTSTEAWWSRLTTLPGTRTTPCTGQGFTS